MSNLTCRSASHALELRPLFWSDVLRAKRCARSPILYLTGNTRSGRSAHAEYPIRRWCVTHRRSAPCQTRSGYCALLISTVPSRDPHLSSGASAILVHQHLDPQIGPAIGLDENFRRIVHRANLS